MNTKKILIFSLAYYPRHIGGVEVAIKEITDRILFAEFEFDMITMAKHKPSFEKMGNVNVYRVGPLWLNKTKTFWKLYKYFFIFSAFFKAVKLHRKNHYDIVWSMMANYAGFAALFFKIFNPSVPFLLTLQEGDPIDYIKRRARPVYPLFKMIFKRADTIQAISNYLADFGKSMGFKGEPVMIPNGVDIKNFDINLSLEEREQIRKELNLEERDIALVTASRLVVKNGVGDVIKALPKLNQNIKFIILGEGELKEKLKELAKKLNVSDRVIFRGFVSHDKMQKYLKACDIFIRPSLSEGMGNSFIEAMATSIPVIGTPVGGIIDFLIDNKTGYLCQPQNSESVAETIQKVISDSNKNQITENAYNMIVEKYDWNLIAQQMKNVFSNINANEK